MRGNRKDRALLKTVPTPQKLISFFCFFASGFLTLVFEICSIRKASLVFGTTTYALSIVVALFFAGFAMGSYVFGRYSHRTYRPLWLFGVLEFCVGIMVFVTPAEFFAIEVLYGKFYEHLYSNFALLSFIRCAFLTILLLPPAFLIGGTLPLFCRQYVISNSRISQPIGFLYGINTLGAALGCLACGFVMIPKIGSDKTMYLCGILYIVIGMIIWKLRIYASTSKIVNSKKDQIGTKNHSLPVHRTGIFNATVKLLFFLLGFVMLGNEILWSHYITLLIFDTVYTYTLTLAIILIGIFLGSFLAASFFDKVHRRVFIFGAIQIVAGLVVLMAFMIPVQPQSSLVYTALWTRVWILATILLVPAILSGATFPLAIRMVVNQSVKAGPGVGSMSAINITGGIAGSITVGFLLLPWIGLQNTVLTLTFLSLVSGSIAWLLLERGQKLVCRYTLIILSLLIWLAIPLLSGSNLPEDLVVEPGKELVDFREGLKSTIAIVRKDNILRLEINRTWQGSDFKAHQVMAAHIPMSFHIDPKRILVIGLGTGQTASRFLHYNIDQLDCVDIENKLVPFVSQYFDSAWMNDRRVRFIIEDGRNYITHTKATYDVISIEVGQTFRPGVASFYTADFYNKVRQQLNDRGILCQFVPIFFLTPQMFQSVVYTFLDVFPESTLWYNTSELLIIGAKNSELVLTKERLEMLYSNETLHKDLDFAHWGGPIYHLNKPEVFLSGFLAGPNGLAKMAEGAVIYRDDVPKLEYAAAKVRRSHIKTNVELIRKCLDPPRLILEDKESGANIDSSIKSIREKNLRNIIAWEIQRVAKRFLKEGRSQEAISYFYQAIQLNPENISINRQLTDELVSLGRLHEAIVYYYKALEIKPDDPETHNNLGNALSGQGETDRAIQHFQKALQYNPDYYQAHYNIALEFRRRNDLDKAVHHYREALRINPNHAMTHNNLAVALQLQGKLSEATKHYQQALQIDPKLDSARKNLKLILQLQDNQTP